MVDPRQAIQPAGLAALGIAQATPGSSSQSNFNLVGGDIVAEVDAGSITFSVVSPNGDDPNVQNPVFISTVDDDGTKETISHTDVLSITIPAGAEFGHVANQAMRLYILGIKVTGTSMQLGLKNCAGSPSLNEEYTVSSFAELNTNSDAADRMYAVGHPVQEAFRIIGYAEWDRNTMPTPGTWVAPDRIRLFAAWSPAPGEVIYQDDRVLTSVITSTNLIPFDDTIPIDTEGVKILEFTNPALAFFATDQDYIQVEATVNLSHSVASEVVVGFQPHGGSSFVAVGWGNVPAADALAQVSVGWRGINWLDKPLAVFAGAVQAGTLTINGVAGARKFGGVLRSFVRATVVRG